MPDAKFDTMATMQQLQRAGVAPQQAEAMVEVIVESQRDLATKHDLATEINLLRMEMNAGFSLIRADMKTAIVESQNVMTLRFGAMLAFAVALLAALELLR